MSMKRISSFRDGSGAGPSGPIWLLKKAQPIYGPLGMTTLKWGHFRQRTPIRLARLAQGRLRNTEENLGTLVCHCSRTASAFGGLLHDQNEGQAGSEHDSQKKEDVDIAHHGGLALHYAKESGSGLFVGSDGVHTAGHRSGFHLGHHVLCQRIVR